MRQPNELATDIVSTRIELSNVRPTVAAEKQISELLEAVAHMATLLAERIFHEAEADYTPAHFQDSAEADRLADVARQLRKYGRNVPSIIGQVLDIAAIHGWRGSSRQPE
jgi:hypothetical protein